MKKFILLVWLSIGLFTTTITSFQFNNNNDPNIGQGNTPNSGFNAPIKSPTPWWQKYNPWSKHFKESVLLSDEEWEYEKQQHNTFKKIVFDYPREHPIISITLVAALLCLGKPLMRYGKKFFHYVAVQIKENARITIHLPSLDGHPVSFSFNPFTLQ